MVLFAKIIPEKIESSMFAFVTGLAALCSMFISPNLGILYAYLLDVNNSNLQELWKCELIQAVSALIPLAFVWLIPKRAQIEKVQRCFEYIAKYEEDGKIVDFAEKVHDYKALDELVARRMEIKDPEEEAVCLSEVKSTEEQQMKEFESQL
jgi:hypothetical protein